MGMRLDHVSERKLFTRDNGEVLVEVGVDWIDDHCGACCWINRQLSERR
jgi:hypothetical protein